MKMKWSVVVFVVFNLSAASSNSLIATECGAVENAEVSIGGKQVDCGEKYPLDEVNEPSIEVTFPGAKKGELYLIAMVDPDAPRHDNPTCQSWLHFIEENVQGTQLASGKHGGHIVTEYMAPTPPAGSGYHRYYIFVLQQEKEVHLNNPSSRCSFDIDDFVKNYNLKPVAMNMFQTQKPQN